MSAGDPTSPPAEFIHLDNESYNVRVVTKDGDSYYKSYHYEQIRDFFTLDHQLRNKEFPSKIPGGYDDFCRAFDRDAKRRNFTGAAFAPLQYKGLEPVSIAWDAGSTRPPTVLEMLGQDADLRSHWEKMGCREMTHVKEDFRLMMAWKYMSNELQKDQVKQRAYDERENKRQRKGLCAPETSGGRAVGTGTKLPRERRRRGRSSSSPSPKRNFCRPPEPSLKRSRNGSVVGEAGPSTLPIADEGWHGKGR